MFAADKGHNDITTELVSAGAELNAINSSGNTALMLAAAKGHIEAVRGLLVLNADVAIRNYRRQQAVELARNAGHEEVVSILKGKGGKPTSKRFFGMFDSD